MSTPQETNTPATPAGDTTAPNTATPANTQSTPPADIAVNETVINPSSIPSKDATIVKKAEPPADSTPTETAPAESVADEPVKVSAPTNYDDMIQGFINGELEDADYAAIEATGLSRANFELMANGVKALQAKNTEELHGYVGGKEVYESLKEFASTNLSEEEIYGYNVAIASGQPRLAKMAALGLKAMMEAERGTKPTTRIEPDGESSDAPEKYNSQAEYLKDTKGYKYKSDKAYAAQVDAKRSRSGF